MATEFVMWLRQLVQLKWIRWVSSYSPS